MVQAVNDRLNGGIGNDTLNGGTGRDTLLGSSGKDTINGGDDNDNINAGSGADVIDGGAGNDIISGTIDSQADEFWFGVGSDSDRVNGYEQGTDKLHLDDALWGGGLTEEQVVINFGSINAGQSAITLDFGNGDVLELRNPGNMDLVALAADIAYLLMTAATRRGRYLELGCNQLGLSCQHGVIGHLTGVCGRNALPSAIGKTCTCR